MQTTILTLHSILRWILLILLLASIIKSFNGWQGKKVFNVGDRKLFLFTLITTHINFLVGLYLLFFGTFGIVNGLPPGVELMKNKTLRFFWVEHPVMMLIAVVLITLGNGVAKKKISDAVKFKKAFWFFFIALVIILASIPWPFREIIGRPLI